MAGNAASVPSKRFPPWRLYSVAGAFCLLGGIVYSLVYIFSNETVGLGPVLIEFLVLDGLAMVLVLVGVILSKRTVR